MEWPILQAGGLLLPKLVEFYQWLHTQLGRMSREEIFREKIVENKQQRGRIEKD
jgi:vacuolar-type H+-ATPase subunit D/Vma8